MFSVLPTDELKDVMHFLSRSLLGCVVTGIIVFILQSLFHFKFSWPAYFIGFVVFTSAIGLGKALALWSIHRQRARMQRKFEQALNSESGDDYHPDPIINEEIKADIKEAEDYNKKVGLADVVPFDKNKRSWSRPRVKSRGGKEERSSEITPLVDQGITLHEPGLPANSSAIHHEPSSSLHSYDHGNSSHHDSGSSYDHGSNSHDSGSSYDGGGGYDGGSSGGGFD